MEISSFFHNLHHILMIYNMLEPNSLGTVFCARTLRKETIHSREVPKSIKKFMDNHHLDSNSPKLERT